MLKWRGCQGPHASVAVRRSCPDTALHLENDAFHAAVPVPEDCRHSTLGTSITTIGKTHLSLNFPIVQPSSPCELHPVNPEPHLM